MGERKLISFENSLRTAKSLAFIYSFLSGVALTQFAVAVFFVLEGTGSTPYFATFTSLISLVLVYVSGELRRINSESLRFLTGGK